MWELIGSVLLVAMLFVLVRPGSHGAALVAGLGHSFAEVITTAIG